MLLLGDSPASEFHMPTFRNTLSHLHRQEGACRRTYLPMKVEQAECSETSVYEFKTPGNHPKGSIQHSGHGESLKPRIFLHRSSRALCYIKTPVTHKKNAQFYNLCILSITQPLLVSILSPSSRSLLSSDADFVVCVMNKKCCRQLKNVVFILQDGIKFGVRKK